MWACEGASDVLTGELGVELDVGNAYAKLAPGGDLIAHHLVRQDGSYGLGRLIRISPAGELTTLADGIGLPLENRAEPARFAVSGSGTLYLADTGRHVLLAVTADGTVSTLAGLANSAG